MKAVPQRRSRSTRVPRPAWAIAAVVVTAIGVYAWVTQETSCRKDSWRIAIDAGGRMQQVVCLVNSARRAALRNASTVTRIVNALPPYCKVILLTNDRQAFVVAANPRPDRIVFLELPADKSFTIWPQDPFVVLNRPEAQPMLLESAHFERADDAIIAQTLAEHLGWKRRISRWDFEGGNLVVGSRHVFIGAETIRENAWREGLTEPQVVRGFQEEFGRPVLVLGPVPQPVGHIDMMVTPLNQGQLMVADAGWGARLAQEQLRRDPQAVHQFEQYCEQMFFGNPHIRHLPGSGDRDIRPPVVVGRTRQAIEDSLAIAPELDHLAEALSQHGYEVVRLPFLFCHATGHGEQVVHAGSSTTTDGDNPQDGQDADKPVYPCLTYNNVLMEVTADRKLVYLPQYGWKAFDTAAVGVWKSMGWEVRGVEGLTISAMYGGSLRCCVKILSRQH